jgi:hypothetical protein
LFCIYRSVGGDGSVGAQLPSLGGDDSVVVVVVVVVVSPYYLLEAPFTPRHRRHRHVSTLSRCASLVFDMLGKCVYSRKQY